MANTGPFEKHSSRYEHWFDENKYVYESELQAVKEQLPESNNGIEIGIGSGRFAAPLGIRLGIEPSARMREIARQRKIEALDGIAEKLPFDDARFDFALMVTTICFVDDLDEAFSEAKRVLKPGGPLIIGFIDKKSPVGKIYQQHKNESLFYRPATFYSVDEVLSHLQKAGFNHFNFTQTIFHHLADVKTIEPVKKGYGEGSFVVIRAVI